MSGEFTTGDTPATDAATSRDLVSTQDGGFATDVPEVMAKGLKNNLPVFEVPEDEFYRNLRADRKRFRFSSDSPVSKYLKSTRYNRPFYIATPDNKYMRKVK
jgi:hypothetical protein